MSAPVTVELQVGSPEECADCADRLLEELGEHDGVRAVRADAGGRLLVEYDPQRCSTACVAAALGRARAGLAGRFGHVRLSVEGMDCADCARTIATAVGRLPHVTGAQVSFATGSMLVEHDAGAFDVRPVLRRVEQLGYRAWVGEEPSPGAVQRRGVRVPGALLTAISTVLLLAGVAVDVAGSGVAAWLYGAAAAVSIVPLARGGVVALWTTHRPEIKLLMTLATIGAAAIGAWMEAALVVVLFSIGQLLEGRAVARARRELAGLVTLSPERARLRTPDGEIDVPVAELRLGDVVVVRPGERLPADGTVVEGRSAVDQAPITGESVPVDKRAGDGVFAGTLNGHGLLAVTVRTAPGETTLARIGRLVAEAQARRAPSERWVDAFARVYTPAVIALAALVMAVPPLLLSASFSASFYSALALLILACPCALVLSTPVTIVSALGRASAAGVLVKGGEQLERAATIRTVAFDKTGTLTAGRPQVVAIEALQGSADEAAVLALAGALEQGSEHPLAAAIVSAARRAGGALAPVEAFEAQTGLGATGSVDGRRVAIGKPAMFAQALLTEPARVALERQQQMGRTAVLLVRDGTPLGVIALADPPRPEAREAIAQLRALGIERAVMITGDHEATARAVAEAVGIEEVRADALPAQKAALIDELGDGVAMVGDGINDAPALAGARLGIAMGSAGSDTAIEVADIALMGDDPRKVAGLIGLARWTRATVRANIAFSLATKLAAAALLAAGMLPLWGAVASDVGASLVVVLYGLRLLIATPGGRLRGLPLLPAARRRREADDHAASPAASSVPVREPAPVAASAGDDCCSTGTCPTLGADVRQAP